MPVIYDSPDDTINKRKFKVFICGTYDPAVSDFFTKNNTKPFYEPVPGERNISYLSIAHMIDMNVNNIWFALANNEDLPIIVKQLELYLDIMKSINSPDENVTNFCARARTTLEKFRQLGDLENSRQVSWEKSRGIVRPPKTLGDTLDRLWRS